MNLSESATEGFLRYLDSHERVNRMIRVGVAGFLLLSRVVDVHNGHDLMGRLVDSAAEASWGKANFPKPKQTTEEALRSFTQMSLVQAVSDYDWLLLDFVTELAQFTELGTVGVFKHPHVTTYNPASPTQYSTCCSEFANKYGRTHKLSKRLDRICKDIGVSVPTDIVELIPLFHFFRLARNCIAHANGFADDELETLSVSKPLKDAHKAWDASSRAPSPPLFQARTGALLDILPHHAIMAAAVCRRLGRFVNQSIRAQLGESGFTRMAAFHSILSAAHPYRNKTNKTAQSAIGYFLGSRYKITDFDNATLLKTLKKDGSLPHVLERWKILKA